MANPQQTETEPQHDVRHRIVAAAEDLFARKGFDATSISDISDAAEVGRALIYYYFKDKRDLYETILREAGERMIASAAEAYDSEGTAMERMRRFIVQFREVHAQHPHIPRIAMRAEMEGSVPTEDGVRRFFGDIASFLARIIEGGIARGELRKVDPRRTVHMVMGLIHSLVIMNLHGEADPDPDTDVDFAIEILHSGIGA